MVVRGFRIHRLSVPMPRRYISGIHAYRTTENVLLELDTGDAVGRGWVFAFLPRQVDAIQTIVTDLAQTLVGTAVDNLRATWAMLWARINFVGQSGLSVMALGAIDTALWDLLAQQANMPLHRLLGAVRSTVPMYGSGGWFTYSKEELLEEALALRAQGVTHYKFKIGHSDPAIDIDRIEYVLAGVGDTVSVMVDANQVWTVEQAIAQGRVLESLGVSWYEEPVAVQDVAGSARVAEALDVLLATGETVFTRDGFMPLIERRAGDVMMPNVVRCGGPSQFMHVATLAESRHLPVSSHTYMEISAQLMAACPNAARVEYIPGWWDALFDGAPEVRDGMIHLSDRPGLGFAFSERALHDFSLAPVVTGVT